MNELKEKHIFIVEDDTYNRVVFQMSLKFAGAIVSFERWGKDALFSISRMHKVDLIILDLMLAGGVSGFDVFTTIRSLEQYSDVPIVAVSAMEVTVAVPKARDLGFSGFISKPIDESFFPKQLVQILNGQKYWDQGIYR